MKKRIKKETDYWWNIIVGSSLTFGILYLSGNLILSKLNLLYIDKYYFIFCIAIIIYYQWKDDEFELFKTEFSKKENFEITKNALDKLNWQYKITSTEIKLTYNKYLLKFLEVTIIPQSKMIYFNIKYYSTSITGRLPFYLGINSFLKLKFIKSLKNELYKKKVL